MPEKEDKDKDKDKDKEENFVVILDKNKEIKETTTEEKKPIIKDNIEEEIEIRNYKTYLNKNEQRPKKINKKEKKETNYDPNIINNLLSQSCSPCS